MRACVDHLHALQEHAIILSLESLPIPRVKPADRLEIDDLRYRDDGITFVRAKHGYAEGYAYRPWSGRSRRPGPRARSMHGRLLLPLEGEVHTRRPSWNEPLAKTPLLVTALISAEPADYFQLPRERTITLAAEIEF